MPELRHPEARALRSGPTVQLASPRGANRRDWVTAAADNYPGSARAQQRSGRNVPVETRNGMPVRLYRPDHIVRALREYEERERECTS